MRVIEAKCTRNKNKLREERLAGRRGFFQSRSVSSENLSLLPDDPNQPMPTPIMRDLQRFNGAQKVAEGERRIEKARSVYAGAWLRETEIKLHE